MAASQLSLVALALRPAAIVDTTLVETGDRCWLVGGAVAISFIHLTAGWRFWAFWNDGRPVAEDEVGEFVDVRSAHEAATAAILSDPERARDAAAMRANRHAKAVR